MTVKAEEAIPAAVRAELERRGHVVETWADRAWMAGSVCCATFDKASGLRVGAADPRRNAYAIGTIGGPS
jgi:gamma-glutamyltranspeptidase/glutathione hydrolase